MTAESLNQILEKYRKKFELSAFGQIRASTARHYREADVDQLRDRIHNLVDAFLRSVPGAPGVLADHVQAVTEQRIHEGYELRELQLMLCLLEREAWQACIRETADHDKLLQALSVVTNVVGHAKDQLANTYLAQMRDAERSLHQLQEHLEDLAKGTDSLAVPQDRTYG